MNTGFSRHQWRSTSEIVLGPILFSYQSWIGNLMSSLSQNRHHKELGLVFDLRDSLHLEPCYTSIKATTLLPYVVVLTIGLP